MNTTEQALRKALQENISLNQSYCIDRYNDSALAENMGCVRIARAALALPTGPAVPTDDDLRELWSATGGRFHGPKVETGTMPEAKLLPFLRGLIVSQPAAAVAPPADNVRHAMVRAAMYADVVAGAVSTPGMKEQAAEDATAIRAALASAQGDAAPMDTLRPAGDQDFARLRMPAAPQPAPPLDAAHGPMTEAPEVGTRYWVILNDDAKMVFKWDDFDYERRWLAKGWVFRTESDARAALQAEKGGDHAA